MTRLYVNSNQTATRIWYFRHRVTNNTIVLLQETTWWNSETCGQIPYMCAINVQRLPVIKPRHTTHVYQDRWAAVHGDKHKYQIVVLYAATPPQPGAIIMSHFAIISRKWLNVQLMNHSRNHYSLDNLWYILYQHHKIVFVHCQHINHYLFPKLYSKLLIFYPFDIYFTVFCHHILATYSCCTHSNFYISLKHFHPTFAIEQIYSNRLWWIFTVWILNLSDDFTGEN